MSEYQYYEFLALDRPLDGEAMGALRAISSRSEITPTRMSNVYHYGNFKGDPYALMAQYFDAAFYDSNWGTRWLMLKLPRALVDLGAIEPYDVDETLGMRAAKDYVLIEFQVQDESGDWEETETSEGWLPSLVPLRADLLHGDLRALYLGWLRGVLVEAVDDDAPEPPVPDDLGALTGPLRRLVDMLGLDDDLLAVAAERSVSTPAAGALPKRELTAWLAALPLAEKDALLMRAMLNEAPHLGAELLRRFQATRAPSRTEPIAPRTAGELRDAAERRRAERKRLAAEAAALQRAQREAEATAARAQHLDHLAQTEASAWERVEMLINTRTPKGYAEAVTLLSDLRDLARREGREGQFSTRLAALQARHVRKPALIAQIAKARLGAAAAAGSKVDR